MNKNKISVICIILCLFMFLNFFTGCDSSGAKTESEYYAITLTKLSSGKAKPTLDSTIRNYVKRYDDLDYLAEALHERNQEYQDKQYTRHDYQYMNISWEDTGVGETYTVHVADNKNFDNEFTYETTKTSITNEIGFFIPGVKYFYKVVGSVSGSSKVDSFIANASVRYISADTVINMRDLGGWKTKDGKTVNYGKLYRGGALNEGSNYSNLSEESRKIFDYLGIKGEIDLRGHEDICANEKGTSTIFENKINSEYPILRDGLIFFAYDSIVEDKKAKNNLPLLFDFLANEDNYPIYFHCSVGADRTGTLAYIIGALLGVDFDSSLIIDYELTSFSDTRITAGVRARTSIIQNGMGYTFSDPLDYDTNNKLWRAHTLLMNSYSEYSTDLQEVMEKYLLDSGVTKAQIKKVKEIMLG